MTSISAVDSDIERATRYASGVMVSEMGFLCKNPKGKYMPVLFDRQAMDHVPFSLIGAMKYCWPVECKKMIAVINGKQQVSPSAVRKNKYAPQSKHVPSYKAF